MRLSPGGRMQARRRRPGTTTRRRTGRRPRGSKRSSLLPPRSPQPRCAWSKDSTSGHQLLLPPTNCCPIFAFWTTQAPAVRPSPLSVRLGAGRRESPAPALAQQRIARRVLHPSACKHHSTVLFTAFSLPFHCRSTAFHCYFTVLPLSFHCPLHSRGTCRRPKSERSLRAVPTSPLEPEPRRQTPAHCMPVQCNNNPLMPVPSSRCRDRGRMHASHRVQGATRVTPPGMTPGRAKPAGGTFWTTAARWRTAAARAFLDALSSDRVE